MTEQNRQTVEKTSDSHIPSSNLSEMMRADQYCRVRAHCLTAGFSTSASAWCCSVGVESLGVCRLSRSYTSCKPMLARALTFVPHSQATEVRIDRCVFFFLKSSHHLQEMGEALSGVGEDAFSMWPGLQPTCELVAIQMGS